MERAASNQYMPRGRRAAQLGQCCPTLVPIACHTDRERGIRFHPTRAAVTLGVSQGGLAPDSLCEDEAACLADMRRLIEEFHDNSRWDCSSPAP